jgi:hypothetical protein
MRADLKVWSGQRSWEGDQGQTQIVTTAVKNPYFLKPLNATFSVYDIAARAEVHGGGSGDYAGRVLR